MFNPLSICTCAHSEYACAHLFPKRAPRTHFYSEYQNYKYEGVPLMKEGFQVEGTNQSGTREQPSKLRRESTTLLYCSPSVHLPCFHAFFLISGALTTRWQWLTLQIASEEAPSLQALFLLCLSSILIRLEENAPKWLGHTFISTLLTPPCLESMGF